MAEYYRGLFDTSHGGKRKRKSIWLLLLDIVMAIGSAAAIFLMSVIFVGRFVNPEKFWYFSLAGLVAPIVYVAVLILFFYWIIRWKWRWITITGIFVLLGMFHVPLYYKMDFTKQYGEKKFERNHITVITFNAHNFRNEDNEATIDTVIRLIEELQPDIVCFQEYSLNTDERNTMETKFRSYNTTGALMKVATPSQFECFSKYRITDAEMIEEFDGTGSGMWADLCIGDDTVRVFNVHLQSTSITPDDKNYIGSYQYIADSARERRFLSFARNLCENNSIRAKQANILHDMIAECRYPVVVCGDFNDVPASYVYRKIAKGLSDPFSSQGHGYPHTFKGMYNMLRIDYILVSPRFEALSYDIPDIDASDHYPVAVKLKLTQNDKKL